MSNGKATIVLLVIGLMKKDSIVEILSKLKFLGANLKVELDLSSYATKANLNNATSFDMSDFAKKTDFANLKSNVNK